MSGTTTEAARYGRNPYVCGQCRKPLVQDRDGGWPPFCDSCMREIVNSKDHLLKFVTAIGLRSATMHAISAAKTLRRLFFRHWN